MSGDPGSDEGIDRAADKLRRMWAAAHNGAGLPVDMEAQIDQAKAQLAHDRTAGEVQETRRVSHDAPAVGGVGGARMDRRLAHQRAVVGHAARRVWPMGWLFGGIGGKLWFRTVSPWWWKRP